MYNSGIIHFYIYIYIKHTFLRQFVYDDFNVYQCAFYRIR